MLAKAVCTKRVDDVGICIKELYVERRAVTAHAACTPAGVHQVYTPTPVGP